MTNSLSAESSLVMDSPTISLIKSIIFLILEVIFSSFSNPPTYSSYCNFKNVFNTLFSFFKHIKQIRFLILYPIHPISAALAGLILLFFSHSCSWQFTSLCVCDFYLWTHLLVTLCMKILWNLDLKSIVLERLCICFCPMFGYCTIGLCGTAT